MNTDQHRYKRLSFKTSVFICIYLWFLVLAFGCRHEMYDQSKYEPLEGTSLFADGAAARYIPAGTVPRSGPDPDKAQTGATTFPIQLNAAALQRGRERFNIYCTPCHDYTGSGNGMIVQRGYRHPPSFHSDHLRQSPPSHYFDVITNGFGAMPSYADKLTPDDRWRVIAYIRVLQFSQNAPQEMLSDEDRRQMEGSNTK